jgi:hypothetical protein
MGAKADGQTELLIKSQIQWHYQRLGNSDSAIAARHAGGLTLAR